MVQDFLGLRMIIRIIRTTIVVEHYVLAVVAVGRLTAIEVRAVIAMELIGYA